MKGIAAYSGITAKIRAMQGRLLTEADFIELSSLSGIPDAVAFLKNHPGYHSLFADMDERHMHRGEIESLLAQAIFVDFQKIYYFSNQEQRAMLKLLFQRYVPGIIKSQLYRILDEDQFWESSAAGESQRPLESPAPYFHPYFIKNANIDVYALVHSVTIEELIAALRGTGYETPLKTVYDSSSPTLLDYELALDMYYFSNLWRKRDRYFSGKDLEVIERSIGSQVDLLNIQWIYRCKKNFMLSPADISGLLIPVHYRLRRPQLRLLIETSTPEEFLGALKGTYYGSRYRDRFPESFDRGMLEKLQKQILNTIYFSDRRSRPYSIAVINSYIYQKETEVSRITTALEGIRYGLNTGEIIDFITT